MKIWENLKTFLYKRRKAWYGLEFPLFCKVRGVSSLERQGAIAQSRSGDLLQIVHAPLKKYRHNVYVYNITLNRVIGYLHKDLSQKLVRLFGKNFCRDGVIEKITGGAPEREYLGCNIRILETMTMMRDCEDFNVLRGQ